MIDLDAIGRDLDTAYRRRVRRVTRQRRIVRAAAIAAALALVLSAVAMASGIGPDLQLDPAKWSILGGGSTDNGRGAYVHAQNKADGGHSTFMVEHDAGLAPYDAFLLHERTRAAADATSPVPVRTEPGALCTAAQLTRAERVALATLRSSYTPGTKADATREAVDNVLQATFGVAPCRGLEWAGERARFVYAGVEPKSMLMPGAR